MKNYHNLEVWKLGHSVTLDIYRATKSFPKEELFGLTSQLRRAASSVPANIAEGSGRGEPGYLAEPEYAPLAEKVLQLRRQLGAFVQRLKG